METIVVGSPDCEAVLSHELSEHTPIKTKLFKIKLCDLLVESHYSLFLGELGRVLGSVGKEIVDLLEAEVLAIVIRL